MSEANKPLLGYWDIRGLGNPIRLMLVYANVEFTDKRHVLGENFDKSDWTNVKQTLGLDFPNLPYYIDENVKLSQSYTITRYLAEKHNLVAKTDADKLRVDLMCEEIRELQNKFGLSCYAPQYEQLLAFIGKDLPQRFKQLAQFLGPNRKFTAGDYVTYVDFWLFEYLELMLLHDAEALKAEPILLEFHERFKQLPRISDYLKSKPFVSIKDTFFLHANLYSKVNADSCKVI